MPEKAGQRLLLRVQALDAHQIIAYGRHEGHVILLGHGAVQGNHIAAICVGFDGEAFGARHGDKRYQRVAAAAHIGTAHTPQNIAAIRANVQFAPFRVGTAILVGGRCPALQAGVQGAHERHGFLLGVAGGLHEEGRVALDNFIQPVAGEGAVVVAPGAKIGILAAVGVGAKGHVGHAEGGAAALASGLVGQIQQVNHGHAQHLRQHFAHVDAGFAFAGFPAAHGLTRHIHTARQLLLGQARGFAGKGDGLVHFHGCSFRSKLSYTLHHRRGRARVSRKRSLRGRSDQDPGNLCTICTSPFR